MKTKLTFIFIMLALFAGVHQTFAQNTVFTYQGRVTDNGTNFNGSGQFEFALVTSTNASHTAKATANAPSGGFITGYVVTAGGNGYVAAPNVTISGGGGSGATAHANISGGMVASITVDNPGNGFYTSAPTVMIAAPPANITYTTYWSNDGTSVAGSEPSAAVSVTVNSGLFTVVLGDPTLPNMAAISASLFSQPNLQLRIWFNDGANGFAALNPVQNLTPTPYAVNAATAVTAVYLSAVVQNNIMNGGSETVGGGNNNATSNYNSTISGGANNISAGNASTVGGGSENNATGDHGAIGGGQNNLIQNGADHSTISGGNGDAIQTGAFESFIGGGQGNLIQTNSIWCMIGGGLNNVIQPGQSYATIGGGKINLIDYNGSYATICGGYQNTANGQYSTVAGGGFNSASGEFSFAAGAGAAALSAGSFVWSDNSSGEIFADSGVNTFNVRALGGVVFTSGQSSGGQANHTVKWAPGGASWSFSSDRNLKDRFSDVNVEGILNKVSQLPVVEWSYKGYGQRHIGPMAQDFHRLFPLNDDDKMLEDADLHGVELAAIQGLDEKVESGKRKAESQMEKLEAENTVLKQANDSLARRLDELQKTIQTLVAKK